MRYILLLCLTIGLTACEEPTPTELQNIDAKWRIHNVIMVYEFTPRATPHMQCIFVSGAGKGGLTCFRKER